MLHRIVAAIVSSGAQLHGRVSYCAQTPWIMAGTVRENITFGLPFAEDLYRQVISSCALEVDFEQFPDGDATELGERGINISGASQPPPFKLLAIQSPFICRWAESKSRIGEGGLQPS